MGHHSQPTYKTIVISDLHLGSKGAKAAEVNEFLRAHSCHQLILNGDIIDGWQLKKRRQLEEEAHGLFPQCVKDDGQVGYGGDLFAWES